uniref:Uncharacterized protein n=1 Tax=Tetradesmus obliquus TaxID=3088 RepID=A0A383VDY1_TETOB|eukprot:jgi/Sobl393_1/5693/SZX62932.1
MPLLRQAAEVPASPLHQQHMASIGWLCRVADEEAFAAASAAVLAVPNVPPAAVHMLRIAGVRVSNTAVLAAALKQQPGAEAWAFICGLSMPELIAQLRSQAGTLHPTAPAAAACGVTVQSPLLELLYHMKGRRWESHMPWQVLFMHPSHIADLLRLAVNQRDEAAAAVILEYLTTSNSEQLQQRAFEALLDAWLLHRLSLQDDQHRTQQRDAATQLQPQLSQDELVLAIRAQQLQQVSPQLLDEPLLLAVARQHSAVVQQLLKLPGVQQLQSSTVAALQRHAVCSHSNKLCKEQRHQQLMVLSELPAAADIGTELVCSLLLEAVTRRQLMSTFQLQQLPAAEQLSSEQVLVVELAAVRSSWGRALDSLALSNFLYHLQPQHMYELLHEAILVATFAGAGMLHMWCSVHATAPRSNARLAYDVPSAPAAIQVIRALCTHDAAGELDDDEHVEQLLLTAAQLGNAGALAVLFKHLPGAADVLEDTHLRLLEIPMQLRNSSMIEVMAAQKPLDLEWEDVTQAVLGLARTGDKQQLLWAVKLQDSAHYMVAEELSRLRKVHRARSGIAALCWSGRSSWQRQPLPQQQQPQQQCSIAPQTQQEDELDVPVPSSSPRATLALPTGAAPRDRYALGDDEWEEVWEMHDLLQTAVYQVPAGQQQQAEVASLAKSECLVHLDADAKAPLLSAAVHVACISRCSGALRVLCAAWPDVSREAAYPMVAAAVQLGCLPVLQLLLQMPMCSRR